MSKFDFHMHSNYSSDGELTCEELVKMAHQKGLHYIALSDHDQISGVSEMQRFAKDYGIVVIPAIECSTLFDNCFECHLLGYGMDLNASYFLNLNQKIKQLMESAFSLRVQKMQDYYGIKLNEAEIVKRANGKNPWFELCRTMFQDPNNAHIEDFQPYLKGGARSDPAPVNFYWDKCQKGSPLYVEVQFPSFESTVKEIHKAGGIAVLAHPFKSFYQREDLIQKAIAFGIDGMEVYSNYHSEEQNRYYHEIAKKYNLLITCGSDFHGREKPNIKMGEYGKLLEEEDVILQNFLNYLQKKKEKKLG